MDTAGIYSYHVFMFPFKWDIAGQSDLSFSERTSISGIRPDALSDWENIAVPQTEAYKRELYNEKSYYYPFTHQVLYDQPGETCIVKHFERRETYQRNITYTIHIVSGKEDYYRLQVRSISLNLYGTGVGVLLFYLTNDTYPDWNDVIRINQFGRRIYPPFIHLHDGITGTKQAELADFIAIEGLNGPAGHYYEDFSSFHPDTLWKPARFISQLLHDFSEKIIYKPVIDDRMFVMCWYGNNELSGQIAGNYNNFLKGEDWYRFLFVDGGWPTCQNEAFKNDLLRDHCYLRWQQYGTLYGITRYSFVFLSNASDFTVSVGLPVFRTMYVRMAELTLVQRASILKFSDEVTKISQLNDDRAGRLVNNVSDLYRQYIRFINKVYFDEVTAQDQGIELYDMLHKVMKIPAQVKNLDEEIEELHSYVNILEDKERNTNIELLTIISSVIIIPTLIIAFAEMKNGSVSLACVLAVMGGFTIFSIKNKNTARRKLVLVYILLAVVFAALLILAIIKPA